jgi:hypothetical protein
MIIYIDMLNKSIEDILQYICYFVLLVMILDIKLKFIIIIEKEMQ